MVIIKKANSPQQIYLSKREKEELKEELTLLYNMGGRNIFVEYNKNLSNFLFVYDDQKNKIGKIVGNSANVLSEIIGKSEDNVFMGFPISIDKIILEYLQWNMKTK